MQATPAAAFFGLLPSEMPETEFADWISDEGDTLVVDTTKNMGYLVHKDGGFTSFRVVTGQRRVVRYIGRTYNARTPVRSWVVTTKEIKWDRVTFGKEGTFLRLQHEGEGTPYGLHSHRSAEEMLAGDERYRSMGCIIIAEDVLDVLEATLIANGNRMNVITTDVLGSEPVTYPVLMAQINGTKDL